MKPITVLFALAALALGDYSPDKSIGSQNAPILIDVFSDFQCPACKVLHDQTLDSVIDDYAKKGKVLLVYHDFPLTNVHPHAMEAARWANAAGRMHKYKQVGDALFRTQDTWAKSGDIRSVVATVLSPDEMKQAEAMMKDPKLDEGISRDVALGTKTGLKSTPTMVLTHKLQTYPLAGIISYPILRRFLDDLATK